MTKRMACRIVPESCFDKRPCLQTTSTNTVTPALTFLELKSKSRCWHIDKKLMPGGRMRIVGVLWQ
jgi:hypothetical protein